ncbi:Retinol dehydrogenase 11 [Gryllus bimaculatus]|nr:Retinol dehydrogenase 11 [Gryllus bimaculatus]
MSVLAFVLALFLRRWVLLVVTAAAACRFWYKLTTGVCTSTRRLDGKTVLITGANTETQSAASGRSVSKRSTANS